MRSGRRHESQQVPSSLVQVVFVTVSLLMPQAFHRPLHALPSSPLTSLMPPTFRHCQPLLDFCLARRTMAPTFSHFHALSSSAYSFYFIIMHACHRVALQLPSSSLYLYEGCFVHTKSGQQHLLPCRVLFCSSLARQWPLLKDGQMTLVFLITTKQH